MNCIINKKQTVIILGVVLIIGVISIFVFNYYVTIRHFELSNTPNQLEIIFDRCACQERVKDNPDTDFLCRADLVNWQNSTHYIDNNMCKFLEIRDGFVIPVDADHCPNAMIAVDGKCMQPVSGTDPIYSIILIALIPITLIVIFVFNLKIKSTKS